MKNTAHLDFLLDSQIREGYLKGIEDQLIQIYGKNPDILILVIQG